MKKIEIDPALWVRGQGYRKQQLVDSRMFNRAGSLVQMVIMAPHEEIPADYHEVSTEFYYVVQGRCRLEINQEQHWLTPGDMILIHPRDIHSLHNESDEPFRLLVVKANAPDFDTLWPD